MTTAIKLMEMLERLAAPVKVMPDEAPADPDGEPAAAVMLVTAEVG